MQFAAPPSAASNENAINKAKLNTYSPQARKNFIAAATQRANLLGLSESVGKFEVLPAVEHPDRFFAGLRA